MLAWPWSSSGCHLMVQPLIVCLELACFTARSPLWSMPAPSDDSLPDNGADRPIITVLLAPAPALVLPPEDPELSDLLLPQAAVRPLRRQVVRLAAGNENARGAPDAVGVDLARGGWCWWTLALPDRVGAGSMDLAEP